MRDLASRLRDIVRNNRPREPAPDGAARALTYEPDLATGPADLSGAAARLGGRTHELDGASCVVVDRTYEADRSHGRARVESYAIDATAPIRLFDPRVPADDWAARVVFFDIETTGLSGGAGMIAFLAGCGWFDEDGFQVRQFLMTGPAGERAMLGALARIFEEASLLVTFNGRTFDVPVMEMRWAFHRQASPFDDLPHFDMLPPARRLWRSDDGCSLTSIERSLLGFHRVGDVPGLEIPARYFRFLRTADVGAIEGVLEHNRHDLMSLAAVTSRALALAAGGPDACRDGREMLALGRLYERDGQHDRARAAFEGAAASRDRDAQRQAFARLACIHRGSGCHDDAVRAWQRVLDLAPAGGVRSPLDRRAIEALAIHHEHRAKDLDEAKRYAEAMREEATSRAAADAARRLARIERKIERASGAQLELGARRRLL